MEADGRLRQRSPPESPKESHVLDIMLDEEENLEKDLEVLGGKLIPRQETFSFNIFGHEIHLRQQLNKCGGK